MAADFGPVHGAAFGDPLASAPDTPTTSVPTVTSAVSTATARIRIFPPMIFDYDTSVSNITRGLITMQRGRPRDGARGPSRASARRHRDVAAEGLVALGHRRFVRVVGVQGREGAGGERRHVPGALLQHRVAGLVEAQGRCR